MKKPQPANPLSCTVIISAYNNFTALRKVLWGYEAQAYQDYDIVIADDGSNDDFHQQLRDFTAVSPLRITHFWQPDEGFRKGAILNHAVRAAFTDYLIFTDADLIPRRDFVANHLRLARRGRYLTGASGAHCELPQVVHAALTEGDVKGQLPFDIGWLRQQGLTSLRLASRVAFRGLIARLCDAITPRPNVFVGCNASAFRDDVLAVKGFDENFGYGGLDRDLGIRLANIGIRGVQHKYSLCGIHLEHARPYRNQSTVIAQKQVYLERKRQRIAYPRKGIEETPLEEVEETAVFAVEP